jgi:hypothetical protein
MAGTLVVAYPKADSVLLWWSSSSALALCLGLASVWIGSVWLRRTGWSPGLLVPAMALMAASVLCYESIFPLFLLLVCLVPLSPRPRRLLAVAAMEGATACGAALYMFATEAKARNALPVGAYATRASQLVTGGLRTYPLGGLGMPTTVGMCFGVGVGVANRANALPQLFVVTAIAADVDVPYRDATIVDIGAHRVLRFSDQQECLAALPRLAEPS